MNDSVPGIVTVDLRLGAAARIALLNVGTRNKLTFSQCVCRPTAWTSTTRSPTTLVTSERAVVGRDLKGCSCGRCQAVVDPLLPQRSGSSASESRHKSGESCRPGARLGPTGLRCAPKTCFHNQAMKGSDEPDVGPTQKVVAVDDGRDSQLAAKG